MIEDLVVGWGMRLPARALAISYSRSGGPGGQNVNKVETKATVRLDVARAPEIPEWARPLLLEKLASRLTKEGELIVSSERHRDRSRNVAAACERLVELLRGALTPRTPRKVTRPTRGSQVRRLTSKRKRSGSKKGRRPPARDDDEW